jgi:menaquinone-specific isochorismate synthase
MSNYSLNIKCEKYEDLIPFIADILGKSNVSSEAESTFSRIELEIPPIDLLDWLYNQKSSEKIYWSNKNKNFEISAIGKTDIIKDDNPAQKEEKLNSLLRILKQNDNKIRYFGGFKFDSNSTISDEWKTFGDFLFILPQFELFRNEIKYYFACNFRDDSTTNNNELINQLKELSFSKPEKSNFKNEILSRKDKPNKTGWNDNIDKAKTKIRSGVIEKIVLSRQTELIFKETISPESLLKKLKSKSDNCNHFLFKFDNSTAFVGATPEKLFARKSDKIECEAIAGTARRGEDEKEDEQLGNFLINSKKDIAEHRYVIKSIIEALQNLVEEKPETQKVDVELLKLSKLQHLISRFEYDLKNNITDYDLYERLHPTAAVGGYPKEQALKAIRDLEMFDRGWYAAPIGWIGSDSTEFVVAIRSGLINNNRLLLYSGAGIIESSDADSEWDEIENKLSNYLNIPV